MTAATDTKSTTKSRSRRAVLTAALGGLGAFAAGAIGKVNPVRAANGDTVTVGNSFSGTSATSITNTTAAGGDGIVAANTGTSHSGLFGHASASTGTTYGVFARSDSSFGTGVHGLATATTGQAKGVHGVASSVNGIGVEGESSASTSIGVYGKNTSGTGVLGDSNSGLGVSGTSTSNTAVEGYSQATSLPAIRAISTGNNTGLIGLSGTLVSSKPKTGVYGYANQDHGSKGVWGFSGKGIGLYGQANKAGYALRSQGRVKFDHVSGVATIPAGSTSVTVSPKNVNVTSSSFVLLTPKANIGHRGLWFSTHPSADSVTIHMSTTRSSNTKVAWLLLG